MTSQINLNQVKRIHFIGIGGIGMSSLSRHFLSEKKVVSGSDRDLTDLTKALVREGITVMCPQAADNITDDIELVIYTEAMAADHPEMLAAKNLKVPMMNYFDALGLAMNPYYLIAIAGSHGKTTTTAMITDIFEAAAKDPTTVVGSLRASTGSNYRAGKSKYAIVEACEFKRDFLSLRPEVLVITNLELEHVDYFKSLADVQDAFTTLVSQIQESGVLICNTKDPALAPVIAAAQVPVIDYMEAFDIGLALKQPGVHNRLNAAAASTVATYAKIDKGIAANALQEFRGTWRRFEYKGELSGAHIYDDYAHHPTEIKVTIQGIRELYPDKTLITIFKPHTYTRTAALFDDFAKSFAGVDEALFLPIYGAREENTTGVSSRELAVKTLERVPHTQYFETHESVIEYVKGKVNPDTVVCILGAGDVNLVANELTK
jgi:UDP-N-acetylmuramate--alanine ligase